MSFIESYRTCMGVVLFEEQDDLVKTFSQTFPEILTFNTLLQEAKQMVSEAEKTGIKSKTDIIKVVKLEQTVARLEGALAALLTYALEKQNVSNQTQ